MEWITPLELLGTMKRQHTQSHALSLLPQATSTITGNFANHLYSIQLVWFSMLPCSLISIQAPPPVHNLYGFRGDGSSNKHGTRLSIISCTKAQEYLANGCHVFLANITATKDEDKSKGKRLEDVPVVREFPEV
ncbi:hypothetical protein Tco_1289747 [Tanacetum coccineum]